MRRWWAERSVEYVRYNGGRYERTWFDDNIAEARSMEARVCTTVTAEDGHLHCLVCWVAIDVGDECFDSGFGITCPMCHETFIADSA